MGACTSCHLVLHWWSGCRDLNPGPLRPERSALPSCATARSELPRSAIILAGERRLEHWSHDRRDFLFGRFVVFDDDLADSSAFDRLHPKRPILVVVRRAGLRYLSREVEDESGDGDVLAFRDGDTERGFDLVDVGLAVDQPTVLAD